MGEPESSRTVCDLAGSMLLPLPTTLYPWIVPVVGGGGGGGGPTVIVTVPVTAEIG